MANLATVQSVAYRLGKGSIDSFQDSAVLDQIFSALKGATLRLSAVLMTEFDRATLTDKYYVDFEEHPYKDQFPKLYLNQGFVDSAQSYTVKLSSTYDTLGDEDDLDPKYLIRADQKGVLLITGSDYLGRFTLPFSTGSFFAQVSYTAGFNQEADENFGYVYTGIPAWLSEAAVSLATFLYKQGDDCDDGKCDNICGTDDISRLVEEHIRFYPSALQPLS